MTAPDHATSHSQNTLRERGHPYMGFHLCSRRLQSGAAAEALGGLGVKAPANCRLIGRWRIVEADMWDRAYLNLSGPATITITDHGHGEIAFGASKPASTSNTAGPQSDSPGRASTKMDEVSGDGSVELLDEGAIQTNSPIIMATKPSLKPNAWLLQQPASYRQPRALALATRRICRLRRLLYCVSRRGGGTGFCVCVGRSRSQTRQNRLLMTAAPWWA
jgi:hypothetical protein